MRVPAAFKWLLIATSAWGLWRAPIVAHDFTAFRAGLHRAINNRTPPVLLAIAKNMASATQPSRDHHRPVPVALSPAQTDTANPAFTPASAIVMPLPPASDAAYGADATPIGIASAPDSEGGALAVQAYQHLRAGDRKRAAALLASAAELSPDDPRAAAWQADRRMLTARWSADAYALVRKGGQPDFLGATPSLGGSQAGARIAYVLNPLSDQRITLSGRVYQPLARHSGRSNAAQAVAGIEIQPSRGLPLVVAIDRYVPLGKLARHAWAVRIAGGKDRVNVAPGMEASFYAQAGVIGIHARDGYADGWAKLQHPVLDRGGLRALAGAGIWAGKQPGAARVDAGPTAELSGSIGQTRVAASIDYRVRVGGNAAPGNGPAMTLRAGF